MTLDLSSLRRHTPNSFTRELGQLVRQAREARELSQAQVAKAIQRRQGTISDIENGKTEPDTSTLLLLAEVLDKPYTYFIPPKWTHRADIQNLVRSAFFNFLASFRRICEFPWLREAHRLH